MLDDDSDDSRDASIEGRDLETIVVANTESDIKQTKAKPSRKRKKPRTTFEVRQREELQRLRVEVDTLKDNLRSLKTASPSCEEKMPFWKRMAHDEKLEKDTALHENEALRGAVDQQATFIDQMKKVLLKKPRLIALELIDESTVYSRIADIRDPAKTWHSNLIRKVYREPDRTIFISRTVLDDALVPQMSTDGVENKSVWNQVAPLDDSSCRITLLIQIGLNEILNDPTAVQCAVDMANRINRILPNSLTVKEGNYPIMPGMFDIDFTQVEHPSIRFFLENAMRIRDSINLALHNVIPRKSE
ncbi:unnamed protein product [Aphanomyces euteiches]